MNSSRPKKVNLSDLRPAPTQRNTLSYSLIKRIEAYKEILGDADQVSVDEAVHGFCRDLNPEKEVEIWERIAHVFKNFVEGHRIRTRLHRMVVLRALLAISAGADVLDDDMLSREQINELRYNF